MVKATEVVYKYVEGEFAVKHKKDGFKANSTRVLIGYTITAKKYSPGGTADTSALYFRIRRRPFPGTGQSHHIQKTSKTALFRSNEKTLKILPVSKPKNAKFNTNFHIGIFARENTVYVIYVDNFF